MYEQEFVRDRRHGRLKVEEMLRLRCRCKERNGRGPHGNQKRCPRPHCLFSLLVLFGSNHPRQERRAGTSRPRPERVWHLAAANGCHNGSQESNPLEAQLKAKAARNLDPGLIRCSCCRWSVVPGRPMGSGLGPKVIAFENLSLSKRKLACRTGHGRDGSRRNRMPVLARMYLHLAGTKGPKIDRDQVARGFAAAPSCPGSTPSPRARSRASPLRATVTVPWRSSCALDSPPPRAVAARWPSGRPSAVSPRQWRALFPARREGLTLRVVALRLGGQPGGCR